VRTRTWLVLLVLVAAAVRFSALGVQSFWADEGFTVEIVRHAFGGVYGAVRRTESTPPLYYYLAWLWRQPFGTGAAGLRSLSALLGTASVPDCFAAAAELFDRRAALVCAALVAVSPPLVWYSQEARAYSLLVFLGLLSIWLCVRAVRGDRRALAGWAIVAALALATQYFALFTVVPEALWLIATAPRERRTWLAVALPVAMMALLTPLLLYQDHHVPRPWASGYSITDAVTGVAQGALVGPTWTPLIHRAGVAVTALLVLGAIVLLVRDRSRREQAAAPAVLLAALIVVPLAGAAVATNYVVIRNVIVAVPLGLMLVAAGCTARAPARLGATIAAGLGAIGLAIVIAVPLTPALQRSDWRGAIRVLASGPAPRVWVVLDRFDNTPVSTIYLPHAVTLGATPAPVSQIEVIGGAGYPGALTAAPVPGFTLVERRAFRGLEISRFTAAHAIGVTAADFSRFNARVVTTGVASR
jgi:mannosyltransferase